MLLRGFNVADGRFTMLEIVIAGTAGNVVGSWVAYGDRLLTAALQPPEKQCNACTSRKADRVGGPLVRALLLAHCG